ncbi:lipopolysaccharide kinase InaA family protein [Mucisphaera sp.]|uniref:lipopolysaccharide kinase InaA family protein n=1 Tax=Mucisphaera sp. TaxID=2913024 RepID=UPI003D134A22
MTSPPPQPDTLAATFDDALEVFKHDHRSRVWLAQAPDHTRWVIKQFLHNPSQQRRAWRLGLHPAQRERRSQRRLTRQHIPVVPVAAIGIDHQHLGYLITPYAGPSLQSLAKDPGQLTPASRHQLAHNLGQLTGQLMNAGWYNRDHKASNIVISTDNQPLLIDTPGIRPRLGRTRKPIRLMIDRLTQTLQFDAVHLVVPCLRRAYMAGLRRQAPRLIQYLTPGT